MRIHPVITTGAMTSGVTNVSTPAKSAEVTETDADPIAVKGTDAETGPAWIQLHPWKMP